MRRLILGLLQLARAPLLLACALERRFGGDASAAPSFSTVSIGSGAWIGEGSIVMASLGRQAIVGAGSVVVRDVPDGARVGGNPARPLGPSTLDREGRLRMSGVRRSVGSSLRSTRAIPASGQTLARLVRLADEGVL